MDKELVDKWVPQKGPHFSLIVLSRQLVALSTPTQPHVIISISEPGRETRLEFDHENPFHYSKPYFLPSETRLGILELDFYDLEDGLDKNQGGYDLFEPEMAQQAFDFIRQHKPELVVVHCEAGASRSPAMATVLMEWQGGDSSHFTNPEFFSPNRRVLSLGRTQIEKDGGFKI